MVTMQYPNSDVLDVLHLYEQLTGKKLVMDNNVQGKVNIFLAKPVPREEAIRDYRNEPGLERVFARAGGGRYRRGRRGEQESARGGGADHLRSGDLPPGAKVVSYSLSACSYADPQELQQVLSQYLAGIGGQAPILALPKSSSLLVTQSADVLRKLVKMVEQIDVAPAEVVSEFIKLERADASKVVDMLKDVFEKGDQTGQPGRPGAGRNIRGVPMPPGQQVDNEEGTAVLSEDSLVVGKIKLEADVRTNRIHVITRPINMPFIEKLIAEFDANVEFGKPVTRPLKYIAAGDVLPVLVQALTEPGDQNQQGGVAPQQPNRQQNRNPTPAYNPTPRSSTAPAAIARSPLAKNFRPSRPTPRRSGHRRQHQADRRRARQHDHRARQSRSGGEGRENPRRNGCESAAGRAQHRDRRVDAEQRRRIRRRLFSAVQKRGGCRQPFRTPPRPPGAAAPAPLPA